MNMGQPWTPDEDKILLSMRKKGKKYKEISAEIGRTPRAVCNRSSVLTKATAERDAEIAMRRKWTRKQKMAFIGKKVGEGMVISSVAPLVGCSIMRARELLSEFREMERVRRSIPTRTRPCCKCRKIFTTQHKCRFLCDSCNSSAQRMGW